MYDLYVFRTVGTRNRTQLIFAVLPGVATCQVELTFLMTNS